MELDDRIKVANITRYIGSPFYLNQEDSSWIISNAFIIFTMQTVPVPDWKSLQSLDTKTHSLQMSSSDISKKKIVRSCCRTGRKLREMIVGFGMLESGCVSLKNEVNIMMKNVVDISLGGLTYWLFGFGISFGTDEPNNPIIGMGGYMLDPSVDDELMGQMCAAFVFQLSFATTSTTIVSGAMAERCNFQAYCIFSFLNTIVYCVPAGWVWGDHGFLQNLGAVDIAGSGTVHLVGGVSALACSIMLGPRLGRYDNGTDPLPLGNPVNAVMGLFVLWWGWLAFNSGSTYGLTNGRWKFAARAAVSTIIGSIGGGVVGLGFSLNNPKGVDIINQINGILGALVSVTGGCFLYKVWESLVVGMVGAFLTCSFMPLLDRLSIDDPVGAAATHGITGMWGMLAIGLFADNPYPLNTTSGRSGLFKGGGWHLLGIQFLTTFCLMCWSFTTSILLLWLVNLIVPIRMSEKDELLGADLVEHGVRHGNVGISRTISAIRPISGKINVDDIQQIGINPGHEFHLKKLNSKKQSSFKKFIKPLRKANNPSEIFENVKVAWLD